MGKWRRLENRRVVGVWRDVGRCSLLLKVGSAPASNQGDQGFIQPGPDNLRGEGRCSPAGYLTRRLTVLTGKTLSFHPAGTSRHAVRSSGSLMAKPTGPGPAGPRHGSSPRRVEAGSAAAPGRQRRRKGRPLKRAGVARRPRCWAPPLSVTAGRGVPVGLSPVA